MFFYFILKNISIAILIKIMEEKKKAFPPWECLISSAEWTQRCEMVVASEIRDGEPHQPSLRVLSGLFWSYLFQFVYFSSLVMQREQILQCSWHGQVGWVQIFRCSQRRKIDTQCHLLSQRSWRLYVNEIFWLMHWDKLKRNAVKCPFSYQNLLEPNCG